MDLPNALQRAVFRLNRSLRARMDTGVVSASGAMLLAAVRKSPGISVSELAAQDGVVRSVISERVTKLESAGLVERSDPGQDGDLRRIGLSLTPAGRETFAAMASQRRADIERRLSSLTPEQRALLEQATSILDQLADVDAGARIQKKRQDNYG